MKLEKINGSWRRRRLMLRSSDYRHHPGTIKVQNKSTWHAFCAKVSMSTKVPDGTADTYFSKRRCEVFSGPFAHSASTTGRAGKLFEFPAPGGLADQCYR